MNESILKALMQLFALISDLHDDTVITSREKDVVRLFLARHLNNEQVIRHMQMFEEYLGKYNSESISKGSRQDRKRTSLNAMRILAICEKINEELQQKQKTYILIQLIDFISLGEEITENELDFLETVANAFFITNAEFLCIRNFILDNIEAIPDKQLVLIINKKKECEYRQVKHLYDENMGGNLFILHIPDTNVYILRYKGNEDLYHNGQHIAENQTYIFDHGSTIRGTGINTIYYSEVASIISGTGKRSSISVNASDVSYLFKKSENGIHNLNFHEESGKLVGILGGSGVGKSTTLNILNGNLEPHCGKVLINGYNLYDAKEKEFLKGVIGYVPQDDLLIEELTVFQNLYFNAKMCLNNLTESKIIETVDRILYDLDLEDTRHLKVGNPLKKIISGGQRKRVNIALELLREPTILFVDEPTSGLSSADSETVMNLLKEQTYNGKLVVINIHQPSSDIYKMFDRIMIIDKGGYQIFYGNPSEAIVYFKSHTNHANPDEDQCIKCGNVNTDQILQFIEAKVVDERGRATRIRRISPKEWAEKYRKKFAGSKVESRHEKQAIPDNSYSIPGRLKQAAIFFNRDFLSKLSNRQFIIISLLGPPFLALLLSYFTRYAPEGSYSFSTNDNLPAYMFMCIITSLFFGLMISSEEVVKDRKILKRESFLNLSWFSYVNSKVAIMFIFSAIQTILFTLVGNIMLGIKGMTAGYWLVLFSTSCFANMLGLNISSAFNSVITIYILIPFIIIPQLLFSGVLVRFDKLHIGPGAPGVYVPVIGDLMTARWSFEAIAVKQFRDNDFERHFFKDRMNFSEIEWSKDLLIPELDYLLWYNIKYQGDSNRSDIIENNFSKLNYHIGELSGMTDTLAGNWKDDLAIDTFNEKTGPLAENFLDVLVGKLVQLRKNAFERKVTLESALIERIGHQKYIELENDYVNIRLKDILTDHVPDAPKVKTYETRYRILPRYEPVYMNAGSRYGRAHFYAPYKFLGHHKIDTYWFNLMFIWMEAILLLIALYFNLFQKLISSISKVKVGSSLNRGPKSEDLS